MSLRTSNYQQKTCHMCVVPGRVSVSYSSKSGALSRPAQLSGMPGVLTAHVLQALLPILYHSDSDLNFQLLCHCASTHIKQFKKKVQTLSAMNADITLW